MRKTYSQQEASDSIPIEQIEINRKSRDDIPALLLVLQHLYINHQKELFEILERHIQPEVRKDIGRPGMDLWQILVIAVLKRGLNSDYNRLEQLVNEHRTIRLMLGHSDRFVVGRQYMVQNLVDNLQLVSDELLEKVEKLAAKSGCQLLGKRIKNKSRLQTTKSDVLVLWQLTRRLIVTTSSLCNAHHVAGWRQQSYWMRTIKKQYLKVNSEKKWKNRPALVERYVVNCEKMVERAEDSVKMLEKIEGVSVAKLKTAKKLTKDSKRQTELVRRRVLPK